MRGFITRALFLCLVLSAPALAAAEDLAASVRYFGQADQFIGADISPDGNSVAIWRMEGNHPQIVLYSVADAEFRQESSFDLPAALFNWQVWADDTRLLVSFTLIDADSVALSIARKPKSTSAEASGLKRVVMVIDKAAGTQQTILEYPLNRRSANGSDDLVSLLRKDADHVLLAYAPDGGEYPGVYRLDITNGTTEALEAPEEPFDTWWADLDGNVRLASGWGEEQLEVKIRSTADAQWESLSDHALFKDGRFSVVGFSDDSKNLYVKSAIGKGRDVIYRFDLKRKAIREKIFEHPVYDAGHLITTRDGREVVAATYVDDRLQFEIFSPKFREFRDKLNAKLNGRDFFTLGVDEATNRWLIVAASASGPADLYLFLEEEDRILKLMAEKAGDPPTAFAPVSAVRYFSRDGLEIPAYLTLPPGREGKALPMIVMPHGGPWVRDTLGFDDWAQFFASLGYGVLQPNFRGSTGYGSAFETRGYGQWGKAMQEDLVDGANWLVNEGYADKNRLCIVGASYGGYAALMGAINNADTFRCAVALAPVTDLEGWASSVAADGAERKAMMYRSAGSTKSKDLRKVSPVELAKAAKLPILLAHGTADIRVAPDHSRRMAERLTKYKKNYTMLWLEGESHFLMIEANRLRFLEDAGRFLDAHIGAAQ